MHKGWNFPPTSNKKIRTLQYRPNGALVTVKILKKDDFVLIEVADTGVGMRKLETKYRTGFGRHLSLVIGKHLRHIYM